MRLESRQKVLNMCELESEDVKTAQTWIAGSPSCKCRKLGICSWWLCDEPIWWCASGAVATSSAWACFDINLCLRRRMRAWRRSIRVICLTKFRRSVRPCHPLGRRCSSSPYRFLSWQSPTSFQRHLQWLCYMSLSCWAVKSYSWNHQVSDTCKCIN